MPLMEESLKFKPNIIAKIIQIWAIVFLIKQDTWNLFIIIKKPLILIQTIG